MNAEIQKYFHQMLDTARFAGLKVLSIATTY